MELKDTLNKPYTSKQRMDFIVEQNHTKGYEIKETETALEAWGYAEEELKPTKEQLQQLRAAAYLSEVDPLTAQIQRLRDEGEDVSDLISERAAKVAEIKARYPYTED